GFEQVSGIEKFESELDQSLNHFEKLYALPKQAGTAKIAALYPFRDIADAAPAVAKLRVKKSPAELAAIQHATDVSVDGHRAAWKRIQPGLYEYQIASTLMGVYLDHGCEDVAYSPIVGSGVNGTVLHYFGGKRRMDQGEVVVMDSAAECANYASDITRTVPA